MRIVILCSTICLTAYATAAAQQPRAKPKPAQHHAAAAAAAAAGNELANAKGTWTIENTVKTAGGADTIVRSELIATATRTGWVTNLAGRPPIPTRVVVVGGDSVVMGSGPFESVVRAGVRVTTRETLHFKGDSLSGTIEAHYSNGQVVKGAIKGARKM
jgi:hypothetical protein